MVALDPFLRVDETVVLVGPNMRTLSTRDQIEGKDISQRRRITESRRRPLTKANFPLSLNDWATNYCHLQKSNPVLSRTNEGVWCF